jgi:hypothetical protein
MSRVPGDQWGHLLNKASCLGVEESVCCWWAQRTAWCLEATDVVVGREVVAVDRGRAIGRRLQGAVGDRHSGRHVGGLGSRKDRIQIKLYSCNSITVSTIQTDTQKLERWREPEFFKLGLLAWKASDFSHGSSASANQFSRGDCRTVMGTTYRRGITGRDGKQKVNL